MNVVTTLMPPFVKAIALVAIFFANIALVQAQDARAVAKQTFPSLVMLDMQDASHKPLRFGSGFFVRPDVIATNYHVIEDAAYGTAKIAGESETYVIEGTIGIDKANDLALLKLTGADRPALTLADISKVEVGEEIYAFGNPRRLEGTISPGIVSGMHFREMGNENWIQISARISSGSSGGPVVNKDGQVIGVAVSSLTSGQNLNFAVPSSLLANLMANTKTVLKLASVDSTTVTSPSSKSTLRDRTRGIPAEPTAGPNHREVIRLANVY